MAVCSIIVDEVWYYGELLKIFSDVLIMNAGRGEYSTERKVLKIRYV